MKKVFGVFIYLLSGVLLSCAMTGLYHIPFDLSVVLAILGSFYMGITA